MAYDDSGLNDYPAPPPEYPAPPPPGPPMVAVAAPAATASVAAVPVDDDVYDAHAVTAAPSMTASPVPAKSAAPQAAQVAVPAPSLAAQVASSTAPAPAADGEPEEEFEETRFVSRKTVNALAAGGTSMIVHCALLIMLGLMFSTSVPQRVVIPIQASIEPPRPLEEVVQRMTQDLKPATQLNPTASASRVGGGIQGATSASVVQPKMNTTVSQRASAVRVDVGPANVFTSAGNSNLASAVPQGTLGESLTTVDGYGEAMDILTREILNRLARGKVLVVWMFDQSLSMKDDQKEIRDRIEKVYTELGLSSAAKDEALWTAVTSYGKTFVVHTQRPTANFEQIRAAIDQVPVDESGEEMMCSAVGLTTTAFRQFTNAGGGRQMMLVLVSDESGNQIDNQKSLEPAITVCKDAKASVYVMGREAVFGYPYAHMQWPVTVPAVGGGTYTRTFTVPVDRGPETPFVELLQTEGYERRTDAHPSGFGPYEQVRIARETGGMFLMLPTPESALFRRDTTTFSFEALRPYLPDVRSREDYVRERDYSKLRSLIWKVINDLNPYKPEIGQYINLRLRFSADPAERNRQIDVELNKAKQYVIYLDAAEKALREASPYRNREKSPRWRAHYDLILAQLVAYKARVYEYGAYLALFKTNPKPFDPPTATRVLAEWVVQERGRTVADKITKPFVDDSTQMLKMVVESYLDTPWSTRAQFELSRGFGIELMPRYANPNPPPGPRPVQQPRPPKI